MFQFSLNMIKMKLLPLSTSGCPATDNEHLAWLHCTGQCTRISTNRSHIVAYGETVSSLLPRLVKTQYLLKSHRPRNACNTVSKNYFR